ncbi:MAG: hypothetical protein ACK56I_16895, partial [bacterium]
EFHFASSNDGESVAGLDLDPGDTRGRHPPLHPGRDIAFVPSSPFRLKLSDLFRPRFRQIAELFRIVFQIEQEGRASARWNIQLDQFPITPTDGHIRAGAPVER